MTVCNFVVAVWLWRMGFVEQMKYILKNYPRKGMFDGAVGLDLFGAYSLF